MPVVINSTINFHAALLVLTCLAEGCSWSPSAISPSPSRESGSSSSPGEGGPGDATLIDDSAASPTDGIRDAAEPARPAATGPVVGTPLATFDSDANGFALNRYAEATNLAIAPAPATLAWVGNEGSPDPGCLKITAPYSGSNQWVDLEAPVVAAPGVDWTGKTLHVRIKVEPNASFSGSARLYVKTGTSYFFYPTAFTPYPEGAGWQEFVLPLVSPAPVPPALAGADPALVVTYGVDPITASAPPVTPTPVTFYVDSFSIE